MRKANSSYSNWRANTNKKNQSWGKWVRYNAKAAYYWAKSRNIFIRRYWRNRHYRTYKRYAGLAGVYRRRSGVHRNRANTHSRNRQTYLSKRENCKRIRNSYGRNAHNSYSSYKAYKGTAYYYWKKYVLATDEAHLFYSKYRARLRTAQAYLDSSRKHKGYAEAHARVRNQNRALQSENKKVAVRYYKRRVKMQETKEGFDSKAMFFVITAINDSQPLFEKYFAGQPVWKLSIALSKERYGVPLSAEEKKLLDNYGLNQERLMEDVIASMPIGRAGQARSFIDKLFKVLKLKSLGKKLLAKFTKQASRRALGDAVEKKLTARELAALKLTEHRLKKLAGVVKDFGIDTRGAGVTYVHNATFKGGARVIRKTEIEVSSGLFADAKKFAASASEAGINISEEKYIAQAIHHEGIHIQQLNRYGKYTMHALLEHLKVTRKVDLRGAKEILETETYIRTFYRHGIMITDKIYKEFPEWVQKHAQKVTLPDGKVKYLFVKVLNP